MKERKIVVEGQYRSKFCECGTKFKMTNFVQKKGGRYNIFYKEFYCPKCHYYWILETACLEKIEKVENEDDIPMATVIQDHDDIEHIIFDATIELRDAMASGGIPTFYTSNLIGLCKFYGVSTSQSPKDAINELLSGCGI